MKILYVSTISNTINAFMIPHIQMLIDKGHSVDIACSVQKDINKRMIKQGCKVFDISFSRSPLKKSNVKAYRDLKDLIVGQKYDLVHTHTPVASAITRLVCKNIKGTKVFYTAHGFHFHKGAPLKNWLIYYPLEKWLAKYTDTLITINKEDYKRAKSKFKAKRVEYIPGVGLDIDKFKNIVVDKVGKRQEFGLPEDAFVVLSVGELNKNKNHEIIIRAIAKLNNPNIHYVICGKGPLESYLKKLSTELRIEENVHFLGYRKNIAEICKVSDIFAFPSFREGLGIAALEAMACGLPIITSNVHGIVDYSIDGETGYTADSNDINQFATNIDKLISNPTVRKEISNKNKNLVNKYSIDHSIKCLYEIYEREVFENV
jgi:glycosyltransferase involved in cell wall biosynthesis